jgi:hypothetical protein
MYDVHNEMMNSDTPWLGLLSYYYTILLTLTRKQITSFCPDKFFFILVQFLRVRLGAYPKNKPPYCTPLLNALVSLENARITKKLVVN